MSTDDDTATQNSQDADFEHVEQAVSPLVTSSQETTSVTLEEETLEDSGGGPVAPEDYDFSRSVEEISLDQSVQSACKKLEKGKPFSAHLVDSQNLAICDY